MSIITAISDVEDRIETVYNAISEKGGTVPNIKNLNNLTSSINTLPIINSLGIPREVSANGVYEIPTSNFTFSLPSNATDIDNWGVGYAFYYCTSLTSVNLSSLTTVSGQYAFNNAFYGCTGLINISFPALTTVSGQNAFSDAFRGCTRLTSVDLSSLTTVSGQNAFSSAFVNCAGLTSVNLSSLTTVSGQYAFSQAFYYCTGLTSISFPALTTISGQYGFTYTFRGCTNLVSVSFPALTTSSFGSYKNQFGDMINGTGSTTTHIIHFPSNMETIISGLTGYPLFGGTSGYVTLVYDLPATS